MSRGDHCVHEAKQLVFVLFFAVEAYIMNFLLYFQLPFSYGLPKHQPCNNQLLHQPHHPLLCQQEVQKLL